MLESKKVQRSHNGFFIFDLDSVPTIPQTSRMLSLSANKPAALFGEQCKHHQPQPSKGKSDRVDCIPATKMHCTPLKSKQPDEVKRSALCGGFKHQMRREANMSAEGIQHSTHYVFSIHSFFFPPFVFSWGFADCLLLPPLCIRAMVSKSFIITVLQGSLYVPFIFLLMPVLINISAENSFSSMCAPV